MANDKDIRHALGDAAAHQLATVTKTPPQLSVITPRWLVHLLSGRQSKPVFFG